MASKIVLGGAFAALTVALAVLWQTTRTEPGAQADAPPDAPAQASAVAQVAATTPPQPADVATPTPGAAPDAAAIEDQIRLTLAERIPALTSIDEISATPMPGLYEVRIGSDIIYTDARGDFLVQGQLIDTRERRNLTQERVDKLSAIDFASLPLDDAIVMVNGTGARKVAVFADPNCGYCKRFERDLLKVADVTVYTFLYPILSPDSHEKSRDVWCADDRLQTWQDWMLRGKAPAGTDAACVTPVERNVEMGRKLRVTGTPTVVFQNGARIPGAMTAEQLERELQANAKP